MRSMNSKKSLPESSESDSGIHFLYAVLVFLGLMTLIWLFSEFLGFTAGHHQMMLDENYVQLAAILSTVNILLLVYLLAKYLKTYHLSKSNFTRGLVLVVVTLLAHAITSNPLFFSNLGFGAMSGPFVFIPSIFTLFTSIVLIYLVHQ